ncbi:MAG TPA: aminotransferase class V-fold PLP-dependent enzyme [bacterium]|nr:aminotransferase class V-fold PLP-dependent enzyme [bacterium]
MELAVYSALKTYSNVHRGTGHNSMVTTELFERARNIILKYFRLNEKKYVVVFCSPRRYKIFKVQLKSINYFVVSSKNFDLPLGIRALAVKKKDLKKCSVVYTGGGMIKHVTSNYVVWADIPERFEAGTPNIVNIIAFAKAIQILNQSGKKFNKKSGNLIKTSKEILYDDDLLEYSGLRLLQKLRKSLIGHDVRVPTAKTIK